MLYLYCTVVMELAVFLLLFSGVLMFQQNQYDLYFERLVAVRADGNIVEFIKTYNFKYNRTSTAVNITLSFLENLSNDTQLEIQAYRFASNEYRLFPMRFQTNLCKAAMTNDFGLRNLFVCGNVSHPCPFKKGIYRMCNWRPVATRFPPHVPTGSYKVDLKFIFKSVEIAWLQLFLKIIYPEV